MALTKISTAGVKDDAITSAKIPAGAVGSSEIASSQITVSELAVDAVEDDRIKTSNSPAAGKFLQYKDGSDKLTWADANQYTHPNHSGEVTSTADGAQVIADDVVDEANLKISNAGTNGQYLQKQSGNTGGLTWADAGGGVDSDSQGNTLGGTNAGNSIASGGQYNTCFGKDAGLDITTGDYNTHVGWNAGQNLTTGYSNTSIGQDALKGNSAGFTASKNVGVGAYTGSELIAGEENVFVGYNSGMGMTNGSNNTFVGESTGQNHTTASSNTFVGHETGKGASGTTGDKNVAVGQQALDAMTTAERNVAVGYRALTNVTEGNDNICIGPNAGYNITTSSNNVIVGNGAYPMTTGEKNTIIGNLTAVDASTADKNTCVGYGAGYFLSTGENNTLVGYLAGDSASPSGTINDEDNIVCLGNNNVTDIYCADTSISSSDKRDKTDVADFTHGLKWINQLKPVTYRWDKRSWYNEYDEKGVLKTEVTPDGSKKKAKQHIGFLAQDVLAVEQADGFASKKDDMLVVNLNEDETAYGLKYERLVPVLVNAIKELSAKVETLETKVAALESA